MIEEAGGQSKVKCLVWDLDDTIWDGILLEDQRVALKEGVRETIAELDRRGILQSIASRNSLKAAEARLMELDIWDYFLYPQIHFGNKSDSIKQIAASLNIGLDSMAFIDDQPYELEEVRYHIPEIATIAADRVGTLLEQPRFMPRFITQDSGRRRQMYREDMQRAELEHQYAGPQHEFLSTLQLELEISRMSEEDLQRAEELTLRTHQLNSTGYTYDYEELLAFMQADDYELWIVSLKDKFGDYGKIGLCLVDRSVAGIGMIKLLLMSCRVMNRGVGSVLIGFLQNWAIRESIALQAEFINTDRNRMMYMTYKFAGFEEIEENGPTIVFESRREQEVSYPAYMKVAVMADNAAASAKI